MSNTDISLIASGALVFIGLIFMDSIKQRLKERFTKLDNGGITLVFLLLLAAFAIFPPAVTGLVSDSEDKNTPVSVLPEVDNHPVESKPDREKTKDEITADIIMDGANVVIAAVDNKAVKDSIYKANRAKKWVYQIGGAKNWDAAWELYAKVKDIPGISFFKEGRKTYRVIQVNNHHSQEKLIAELTDFKSKIAETNEPVEVIDLMQFCSKREDLKEDDNLRNKRKDLESRCFICD